MVNKTIIVVLIIAIIAVPLYLIYFEEDNADGNKKPNVKIIYPQQGATVSKIVIISGTASDPDGTIQQVLVRFDVHHEGGMANGTTNWSYIWDTTTTSDGVHTIYARSYDGEYNSNIESINSLIT